MDTTDFPLVIDDFSYDDVNQKECVAKVCKNICNLFVEEAEANGVCFLTICIPCYNENVDELMKTISSLMSNIEFIKHKVYIFPGSIYILSHSACLHPTVFFFHDIGTSTP